MIKTIKDPVYKCSITLLFREKKDKVLSYLSRNAKRNDMESRWNSGSGFFCNEWYEGMDNQFNFFIVITDKGEYKWEAVLAHESLHVTSRILRERGLELTDESEEAFTYYLGWIIENFTKAYKKKGRKK